MRYEPRLSDINIQGDSAMNAEVLRVETVQYRALHDQLQQRFDGLDDETLKNTLEGLSDLPEILAELVRSAIDDEAMIAALKMRCEAMAARLSRLKERHQKKRVLAAWAMTEVGLPKLKECDFTASVLEGALRLEVQDESFIPEIYFVPQPPKLDKAAITAALKRGETVDGAQLVQGQPYITVSTR
jgi:hypothetical protein